MVHADAQVVVALDQAVQRLQLPRHQLKQRRLACAVSANNRHTAVEVDAQVNATAGANNQQGAAAPWSAADRQAWRVLQQAHNRELAVLNDCRLMVACTHI